MPDLVAALGLSPSRSEAKRLLAQGAVQVDGEKLEGNAIRIKNGMIIRAGRRRYIRLEETGT